MDIELLLSILGSPYVNDEKDIKLSNDEKSRLYEVAYRNKVGLFFLNKLKQSNSLGSLEKEYCRDLERYQETCKTAIRLSSALMQFTQNFALFKFMKPYPHTPSDVDVLFFLSNKEYLNTVDQLINYGYFKIAESPSQIVVYDLRAGYENMDKRSVGGKKGGKYYIDLYGDVSASHFVYINQESLKNHRTKIKFEDGEIQTLNPLADLSVVLTHSIIPEQLFTLGDYYTALNYIKEMKRSELNDLVAIFKSNNITHAGIESLNLTNSFHNLTHGFRIDKIDYLIEEMGGENTSIINLDAPYRYDTKTLFKVLLERMRNKRGIGSMGSQLFHTATNPQMFKWVLYNIVFRRSRDTY